MNQQIINFYFQWWLSEIKHIVPRFIRDWFLTQRGNVALELGDRQLTVSRYQKNSDDKIEREQIALDEVDDADMANRIMRRFDVRMTHVILRLSPRQVLRKVISAPMALEENLKEALSYEIDRHTPFRAEQIYYDVAIVGRNTEQKTLDVLLAVVTKKNVHQMLNQIEQWNLAVDSVQMAGARMPNVAGAEDFNPEFISEQHASEKNKTKDQLNLLVAGVTLALFFAVLIYPLTQQEKSLDALRAQIASTQKEAKIATQTRNQLERIIDDANFIVKKKRNTLTALAILNELTRVLPDDSYLTLLEVRNNSVRIQGQSSAASDLITFVEQSALFQGAKFNGQLTKDRKTGLQRFYLTANLIEKVDAQ